MYISFINVRHVHATRILAVVRVEKLYNHLLINKTYSTIIWVLVSNSHASMEEQCKSSRVVDLQILNDCGQVSSDAGQSLQIHMLAR